VADNDVADGNVRRSQVVLPCLRAPAHLYGPDPSTNGVLEQKNVKDLAELHLAALCGAVITEKPVPALQPKSRGDHVALPYELIDQRQTGAGQRTRGVDQELVPGRSPLERGHLVGQAAFGPHPPTLLEAEPGGRRHLIGLVNGPELHLCSTTSQPSHIGALAPRKPTEVLFPVPRKLETRVGVPVDHQGVAPGVGPA